MGASTADCIWQKAEPIPEFLNPERNTIVKYRLLGKSGLRVSEASLGAMTFGDEWGSDEATILRLGALIEAGNKAQHRRPNL
jgi:hypothetical protein